jgi:hypothetical protein
MLKAKDLQSASKLLLCLEPARRALGSIVSFRPVMLARNPAHESEFRVSISNFGFWVFS